MQVGDINLVNAIVDLELRTGTLEKAYDFLLKNNYSLSKPSQSDIDSFRDKTLADLQKKYPNMGIAKK